MTQKVLREIKQTFREFCGCLTIEEITSNARLISSIEQMERLLIKLSA